MNINKSKLINVLRSHYYANAEKFEKIRKQGKLDSANGQKTMQVSYALQDLFFAYDLYLDNDGFADLDYYARTGENYALKLNTKYQNDAIDSQPALDLYREILIAKNAYNHDVGRLNPNYDYRLNALRSVFDALNIKYQQIDKAVRPHTYTQTYADNGAIRHEQIDY